MSKNRTEQVIEYIRKHPEKSGNQIYLFAKVHGFGIQKQRFYQIYRQEKIQPSVKKVKKIIKIVKKVPKKKLVQKKIIPKIELTEKEKILSQKLIDLIEYPEDPNVEYGLIEIYDKTTKESRWIKYHDKTHLDWQIDILEASERRRGYSPNFQFIYHGLQTYTPFIAPEFEEMMDSMGE